jgi:hypothetical protein
VLGQAAQILLMYHESQQAVMLEHPLSIIQQALSVLLRPPNLFDSMQPPQGSPGPLAADLPRLANALVTLGSCGDQIVAGLAAEALAVLMWVGVSPAESRWNAKDTRMLKNAIYYIRHYDGKVDA